VVDLVRGPAQCLMVMNQLEVTNPNCASVIIRVAGRRFGALHADDVGPPFRFAGAEWAPINTLYCYGESAASPDSGSMVGMAERIGAEPRSFP
jgi:hypothetical protein